MEIDKMSFTELEAAYNLCRHMIDREMHNYSMPQEEIERKAVSNRISKFEDVAIMIRYRIEELLLSLK